MPQSIAQSSYYASSQQKFPFKRNEILLMSENEREIYHLREIENLLISEKSEQNSPFNRNREPAHE